MSRPSSNGASINEEDLIGPAVVVITFTPKRETVMSNIWFHESNNSEVPQPSHTFVDIRHLSRALGCSERQIRRLVAAGEFPKPIKVGRLRRWPKTAFDQWLARKSEE